MARVFAARGDGGAEGALVPGQSAQLTASNCPGWKVIWRVQRRTNFISEVACWPWANA